MDTPTNSLPGVPAGSPAPQTHPPAPPAAPVAGQAGVARPLPFGGNIGKRVRADGLKAGSPEAREADRIKDRERKRQARAQRAAQSPPPPLPASGTAPPPAVVTEPAGPQDGGVAGGDFAPPPPQWIADDLKQVAIELVELGEAQRVDAICKKCLKAKLPAPVLDEFKAGAAFPPATKKSLSASLPGTLASAFNALSVPIGLKSIISAVPALSYLILRDYQLHAKLDKIIAADAPEKPIESEGKPANN